METGMAALNHQLRELVVGPNDSTVALRDQPLTEAFRLLALDVEHLTNGSPRRSIAVISAYPRDGRSLVATLLARALAEVMPPVVLLDADLNGAGLSGVPLAEFAPEAGQRSDPPGIHVIAPKVVAAVAEGDQPRNGYLHEIRNIISEAEADGLTLIIDTPAATVSSAAFSIAAAAAGAIYVARRGARTEVHRDIRAQLDLLGARMLGVVFNEA
jgi:Mrp family chromosome partitioning ATPase